MSCPVARVLGHAEPNFQRWIDMSLLMCKDQAMKCWCRSADRCTNIICTTPLPKYASQGPISQQPRWPLHLHLGQHSPSMPRFGCCYTCLGSSTSRNQANLAPGYRPPNMFFHLHMSCLVHSNMDPARQDHLLQPKILLCWNKESSYYTSTACIGLPTQAARCLLASTCCCHQRPQALSAEKNSYLLSNLPAHSFEAKIVSLVER